MRQFHGDHGGNRLLAGQRVDQTLADQDGVAHRGGLHGIGQQNAAMDLVGKGQVIGHHQVDHDLAQNLFLVAALVKGATRPASTRRSITLFSAWVIHMREACSGPTSCESSLLSTASSTFTLTFSLSRVGSLSE